MAISTSRLPRRTCHPPISYRDVSTDDEITNPPPTRSSQRTRRTTRHRSSSDQGSATLEELPLRTARRSRSNANLSGASRAPRSSRRARYVNYYEESDEEFFEGEAPVIHPQRHITKPTTSQRNRPRLTEHNGNKGPFNAYKRRKTSHVGPAVKGCENKTATAQVIAPGKIPPWQTLPYQILLSILQYASYPFYRDASHDTGSITWLINVSTLSKSFHDAAIATLLYSPPLFPADLAHGLEKLLSAPQDTLSTPYQNKVKRLDVEVRSLLIKKSGIDLVNLIKQTPLLKALHLYHNYDRVGAVGWAQPSASTGKSWSYPVELFDALDENGIRLKDWTWNGRFPDTKSVLDQMKDLHARECLKGLTSMSTLNLTASRKVKNDVSGALEDLLTTAIKNLPDLQELKVENCSIINERMHTSLSSKLRHLSITNCGNFNSTDFRLYLVEHGYKLEELILSGNQALDLGFTGDLEALCPRLRLFSIDLTYSDPTAFHDVDPHYEGVFPDGIMPTWPRTLQTINIENLRNLDAGDAESFLKSLIAVAPELKDLRKLSIRILLQNDGWRERARLRQIWMPKLEDVFLRKAAPPMPFIPPNLPHPPIQSTVVSIRPSTSHSTSSTSFTTDDSTAASPNKRKSSRIAKRELDYLATSAAIFDKAKPRMKGKATATAACDDDEDDSDGELPRQGMCSEVILHIDGQRPADEQFKEADFLDDELSGDEDWNGKDVVAPAGYAW
jgi:hypothetical protein